MVGCVNICNLREKCRIIRIMLMYVKLCTIVLRFCRNLWSILLSGNFERDNLYGYIRLQNFAILLLNSHQAKDICANSCV